MYGEAFALQQLEAKCTRSAQVLRWALWDGGLQNIPHFAYELKRTTFFLGALFLFLNCFDHLSPLGWVLNYWFEHDIVCSVRLHKSNN